MGMWSDIQNQMSEEIFNHFEHIAKRGGGPAFPIEATYKKNRKMMFAGVSRVEYYAASVASSMAGKLIERCIDEDGEIDQYRWKALSEEITKASYTLAQKLDDEANNL